MNLLSTYYTTHKPYVYNLHLFSSQQIRKQMLLTVAFFHARKLSTRKLSSFLKVTQETSSKAKLEPRFFSC